MKITSSSLQNCSLQQEKSKLQETFLINSKEQLKKELKKKKLANLP